MNFVLFFLLGWLVGGRRTFVDKQVSHLGDALEHLKSQLERDEINTMEMKGGIEILKYLVSIIDKIPISKRNSKIMKS